MKIGIVCPYSFDFYGGVMEHILDLSDTLIKKGHTVKVLAPGKKNNKFPDYIDTIGATLSVPVNGSVARIKFGPQASKSVQSWLSENKFDVLHVHEPTNPSVSILALYYADCPVVATFHAFYKKSVASQILGTSIKNILSKITVPIAVSENAKQTAMENFKIKPVVIPNGIKISNFANTKKYKRKKNTILFLGRVNEKRKGLNLLLKSMKYIIKNIPNAKLLIAGSGELSSSQLNTINKYPNNIKVLGEVSNDDKHKLLLTSSVYVAPQLFGESFGIVLLEAFASKIPVVASAIPAFIDISDGGKVAMLFARKDKKHLARKVVNVLSDDEANVPKMVNSAERYVRQYDWNNVASNIEKIYKKAIQ